TWNSADKGTGASRVGDLPDHDRDKHTQDTGVYRSRINAPPIARERRIVTENSGFFPVSADDAARGNRAYWNDVAAEYLADHGDFLGDADFRWCPEGLREADAALLGPVAQLRSGRVLEVGAGAAQCSRW